MGLMCRHSMQSGKVVVSTTKKELKSSSLKCERIVVSYPDPSTSQLRMDYITATLELGSGKVTAVTDGMLIVCTRDRQLDRNSIHILMF